jgi:hypothetical protein
MAKKSTINKYILSGKRSPKQALADSWQHGAWTKARGS